MLENRDPLLALLRRYESGLDAFNKGAPTDDLDQGYWDKLARDTWYAAQLEIIRSKPSATTATGALAALDHVLNTEELFFDLEESPDLQMLWQLIKGVRDYIASLDTRNN